MPKDMSIRSDRTASAAADDALEVRQLIESWAAAVRDEDLERILAHHSEDMLMFDVPPPTRSQGIAAYRKTWDTFFRWSSRPHAFDLSELNVTAGESVAFATALIHCKGVSADGTVEELDNVRLTIGLRKRDGRWTVLHEHHSIPAS
jgi:uncharacterized protein (TIGR02246 family)